MILSVLSYRRWVEIAKPRRGHLDMQRYFFRPGSNDRLLSGCVALLTDGETCGDRSLPGAPFPLCDEHAIAAYRFISKLIRGGDEVVRAVQAAASQRGRKLAAIDAALIGWPEVVYYLRIGDHVKIGWTRSLGRRLTTYPPSAELLAVEPGGHGLETTRHEQFASLRAARDEWFTLGPALAEHIRTLQAAVYGASPSTTDRSRP